MKKIDLWSFFYIEKIIEKISLNYYLDDLILLL